MSEPGRHTLEQERVWEAWARADPLWAILSDPARRGRKWGVKDFFATGTPDVQQALELAARYHLPARRERALDFGCGVGRLTQALGQEFDHVDGVDISETMVMLARELNQLGSQCDYHVNVSSDLALLPDRSMDFILSTMVLQHIPPEDALTYISDFVRLLSDTGAAIFDMPAAPQNVRLPEQSHLALLESSRRGLTLRAGATAVLECRVRNISSSTWPAGSLVRLGNHWRAADGEMVLLDDGRTPLTGADVPPQATVYARLSVTAPNRPGTYVLELDVVEEGVCWFSDREGAVLSIDTEVRPRQPALRQRLRLGRTTAAGSPDERDDVLEPFTMNALSQESVTSCVVEAGGRVVDAAPIGTAGPEWEAYRYVVTRD